MTILSKHNPTHNKSRFIGYDPIIVNGQGLIFDNGME